MSEAQDTSRRQNLAPCLDFRSRPCGGSSQIVLFLPRIHLSPSFSLPVILPAAIQTREPDFREAFIPTPSQDNKCDVVVAGQGTKHPLPYGLRIH